MNPYIACMGFICEELCNQNIVHYTDYDEYGNVLDTCIHAYRYGKTIEVKTNGDE